MQIIDIAVASGYAALCLSLIVLMNPVASQEVAAEAGAESSLDSAILAYMGNVGLPFLAASPASAVCASAAEASNSTVEIGVLVGGSECASQAPPPSPLASSSLTLELPSRTVVLEAWLVRR